MTQARHSTSQHQATHLEKGLGLKDAIALVVGTIIGTGIFLKAAIMTQTAGSIAAVMLAWVVAAVLSLLGALCYAELGSRMPESGGEYVFLKKGWHPAAGFLYGWTRFWIGSPSAISAYAAGSAAFAAGFMNVDAVGGKTVFAISLVWIFTVINCFRVNYGGKVQVALTVMKIGLIVSIAAGVFILSPAGDWAHFTSGPNMTFESLVAPSFGAAVLAALWAFDGWNNMPMAAAEIRDGQRNVPKALITGIGIVTLMYVIANLAWFYGVHYDEIITSNSTKFKDALPVASKAVLPFMGQSGVAFVSAAFVLSAIGAMNGSILTSARVPWAMARDGLFPNWMAKLNPATHVPVRAILIQGVCATLLAASGTFDQLTDYVVFSSWIWYAMAAASLFRLRKIDDNFQGYRIKWFPLVPILFIASSLWLMLQAIYSNPIACAIGAVIIMAGIPVYWWLSKNKSSPQTVDLAS
jgi:APA family basic amino acid/polyamine antiporter